MFFWPEYIKHTENIIHEFLSCYIDIKYKSKYKSQNTSLLRIVIILVVVGDLRAIIQRDVRIYNIKI